MRNLSRFVAILTVSLAACPTPKEPTEDDGAGGETTASAPEPAAKGETGGTETGGADSTCQDELDRVTAELAECKAGAN